MFVLLISSNVERSLATVYSVLRFTDSDDLFSYKILIKSAIKYDF